MDGALSNNQPLFEFRNTLTFAPFSGESDICPTEGAFNFLEVHYGNVSIQVNTGNVYRVWTSFMPTPPQVRGPGSICEKKKRLNCTEYGICIVSLLEFSEGNHSLRNGFRYQIRGAVVQ